MMATPQESQPSPNLNNYEESGASADTLNLTPVVEGIPDLTPEEEAEIMREWEVQKLLEQRREKARKKLVEIASDLPARRRIAQFGGNPTDFVEAIKHMRRV